jgi:hypothetical protein
MTDHDDDFLNDTAEDRAAPGYRAFSEHARQFPPDMTDWPWSAHMPKDRAKWAAVERAANEPLIAALQNLLDTMPAPRSRRVTAAWDAANAALARARGKS